MKFFLLFILIFGFIIGCKKSSEECPYSSKRLVDTTLFIKFNYGNREIKYYQFEPSGFYNFNSEERLSTKDSATNYFKFNCQIDFVSFTESNIPDSYFVPELWLTFSKKVIIKNPSKNVQPLLQDMFTSTTIFTKEIDYMPQLKDTLYMDGVCLGVHDWGALDDSSLYQCSTSNAYRIYQMNEDSINSFFSTSQLTITKVEEVCDKILLIEGTFKVKLITYPSSNQKPKIFELNEGQFRFIRHE